MLFTVFAAGIGGTLQYGLNLTTVNAATVSVQNFINETWTERYGTQVESNFIAIIWSFIVTAHFVGGLMGSLIAGPMAIKYGRRNSLLLSNIFILVAALLMGLSKIAKSFEMIIVGRIFSGINSGVALNIHPMYLGESATKQFRGSVTLSFAPFTAAGLILGQTVGLREVLGSDERWPLLLSSCAAPALLQLMILPWFPESPRYLLIDKGDKYLCLEAMRRFHGNIDLTDEMEEMLEEKRASEGQKSKNLWELFRDASVRRQLIIVFVLSSAIELCGNDAMYFYTTYVLRAAGIPEKKIQYAAIGTGICEFMTSLSSKELLSQQRPRWSPNPDKRKELWSTSVEIASPHSNPEDALTLNKFSWMPYVSMICLFASILSFGIGPAGVTFLLPTEIFDQNSRPVAYMLNGSLLWINLLLVGMIFPLFVSGLGPFCCVPFICVSFLSVLFIGFFVPETKGKTLMEISQEFQKRNFKEVGQNMLREQVKEL
ncbi:solute carrier family 2, facilitated glucose transporter member 11 isoform X3 [Callorhinchus milii]|nr:solute carrier family 2, facilitated glucose transporter member 11 isoform X3 [Callorhinchus milii]|eukprot:gi/632983329/ref/XP_007908593.1/ PREDICTED: solute carrier family 2, facilitated glucose transporter member 11-like isoform X3 [Callorhinchus milii]